MKKEIPKVDYNNDKLDIEVVNFSELSNKLNRLTTHNPFAVHRIEFFLILIVTKNAYTHFVDFKSYTLVEGSTLFIAKNQVHHFTKGLQEVEGYCLIFNSHFINKDYFLSDNLKFNRLYNYHIESPIIYQREMGKDNLIDTMKALYDEYNFSNHFGKTEILRNLLQVLLFKAERAKDNQSINSIKKQWLEIFIRFKNILEKEYISTRSSRYYAAELFISYKFLNDVVKELTGNTVKSFIDEFVTTEIKRYLVSTALSVKEISYKTGFEEPANLIKFFKKHTQVTPLKFRQQFQ